MPCQVAKMLLRLDPFTRNVLPCFWRLLFWVYYTLFKRCPLYKRCATHHYIQRQSIIIDRFLRVAFGSFFLNASLMNNDKNPAITAIIWKHITDRQRSMRLSRIFHNYLCFVGITDQQRMNKQILTL